MQKANRALVVVDMQNDFIGGSLGTREAQAVVPNVISLIKGFDGDVLATQDTHDDTYPDTQEGRLLPVAHCRTGTDGWEFPKPVGDALNARSALVFQKDRYASLALAEHLKEKDYEEILLCGICTDICVISNALLVKAHLPETRISVDASCCAGISPQLHQSALDVMRSCQVHILHEA